MWDRVMYHISTHSLSAYLSQAASLPTIRSVYASRKASFLINTTPVPVKAARDIPERDLWRTRWFIRVLPQDPGSGRRRRTSPGTAAQLPSPAEAAGMDLKADPQPYSPPLSPCGHPAPSLLPPLLVPLWVSACRGALHRTGPQWPWVINGLYGAGASFPSTFVCYSLSPTPLRPQQPNVPMVTAAGNVKNCSFTTALHRASLLLGCIN